MNFSNFGRRSRLNHKTPRLQTLQNSIFLMRNHYRIHQKATNGLILISNRFRYFMFLCESNRHCFFRTYLELDQGRRKLTGQLLSVISKHKQTSQRHFKIYTIQSRFQIQIQIKFLESPAGLIRVQFLDLDYMQALNLALPKSCRINVEHRASTVDFQIQIIQIPIHDVTVSSYYRLSQTNLESRSINYNSA